MSMQYDGLLVNVTRVCRENFVEMDFKDNKIGSICKERDLIRSAVPSSCYILSIMPWVLNNVDAARNVRVVQSEMMYKFPREHIANILCWVKGIREERECQALGSTLSIRADRWRVSEKQKKGKIDEETIGMLQKELRHCNVALQRFIIYRPELQLFPFDLTLWQ